MNNTPHIVTYALHKDLQNYADNQIADLPASIIQDLRWDQWIDEAAAWVLAGKQATFDPTQPSSLTAITEWMKLRGKENDSPKDQAFAFRALDITANFPDSTPKEQGEFTQLWKDFEDDFQHAKELTGKNPDTFCETFYFLLKKYTSFLPVSNSGSLKAVSLFEYLKLRAAIADCLHRVEQSGQNPQYPLIFFCADISGIQDFIYNIVRSKALKALKGRSFYLQLLLDSLTQQLINQPQINITLAHIVYSSGGKMYVLLPNTTEVQAALSKIQKELNEMMWDKHQGRLQICMGQLPFRYGGDGLFQTPEQDTLSMSELWNALKRQTALQKRQPYRSLLKERFDDFFTPIDEGLDEQKENRKICSITGELISFSDSKGKVLTDQQKKRRNQLNELDKDKAPIYVSKLVKSHAKLGYQMKNVMYYNTPQQGSNSAEGNLGVFSTHEIGHALKRNQEVVNEYFDSFEALGIYLPSFKHKRIRYVNTSDFLNLEEVLKEHGAESSYGFYFYGGNQPAFQKNEQGNWLRMKGRLGRYWEKETQQLAGEGSEEDKHKGFHRLAVLRMDVDNLGSIFTEGLQDFSSMAAYSTFSAQLDWFFGGYLNHVRNHERSTNGELYEDWVNILYAGGDDLFLYGRWDMALDMAMRIRRDFGQFVANRPGLSLSGGLALIGPKFPFSKGAEWAGKAEKEAKNHPEWQPELKYKTKNAFNFLGQSISWEHEFPFVQAQMEEIYALMDKNVLKKHFIYKLYNLYRLKEQGKNDWLWLIVYTFSQHASQASRKGQKDLMDFFHKMKNNIFTGKDRGKEILLLETPKERIFDLYILAFQWAELKIRQQEILSGNTFAST